jgi:sialic acid synthase SpsE
MRDALQSPVGYSDHTPGIEVALAAVALGACVIEKHLTLDRGLPGPDHRASSEPTEFAALVSGIRIVESALGHGRKEPAESEMNIAKVVRKSLVAAQDIQRGEAIKKEFIAVKRPGTGLPPSMAAILIGRKAKTDIPVGTLLTLDLMT